jgi:hypothetical protein
MKTFHVKAIKDSDDNLAEQILITLKNKGMIDFWEINPANNTEPAKAATEEQVQEIIDEAELGPFYSEKEAKDILDL